MRMRDRGGSGPLMANSVRTTVLLLFLLLASAAAQNTPQVVLQGRFSPAGSSNGVATLPQTFSWSASSVYSSFEGASAVTINITALPQQPSVTYSINWFRFFIDGSFAADGFTSYNQLALQLTIPVSSGRHTLRIAKMNDGAKGEAVLNSISLTGGSFLPPSGTPGQVSDRRILFIGDSYTVGYGDAGAAIPGTCTPTVQQLTADFLAVCGSLKIDNDTQCTGIWQVFNQNGLEAFGPVTATSLGADYQVVAASGSGLVGYSYIESVKPGLTMEQYEAILPTDQAMFNRSIYSDIATSYPVQSWQPQVVVVASGTNDWHSVPPLYTLEEWVTQAVDFLQEVSQELGQPIIIIQAWPPEQQLAGALAGTDGYNETIQYIQAMPSLFTEAVRRQLPNVHYLQLDTSRYDNMYAWCDGHPSAVAHRAVAQQLASFIQALLPQWTTVTPINSTVDQQAIRPRPSFSGSAPAVAPAVSSAG